jgi:hypothetical protein
MLAPPQTDTGPVALSPPIELANTTRAPT